MALNTVVALLDEISALSKPLMATLDDVAAGAVLAGKKSTASSMMTQLLAQISNRRRSWKSEAHALKQRRQETF